MTRAPFVAALNNCCRGLHEIVPPQLSPPQPSTEIRHLQHDSLPCLAEKLRLSLFDDKELELLISGLPDIDIEEPTCCHRASAGSEDEWFSSFSRCTSLKGRA